MSGDLWASRLLMSQWPNSTGADRISEATQFSISPAPASTSAASKKGEGTTRQLAHFGQPLVEAFFSRNPSTIETRKEIRNSSVFSRNKTNKKTILAQLRGDQDKERDGVGGALRMLGNGADFPIGPHGFARPRSSVARQTSAAVQTLIRCGSTAPDSPWSATVTAS